jgi:hypothetical protein
MSTTLSYRRQLHEVNTDLLSNKGPDVHFLYSEIVDDPRLGCPCMGRAHSVNEARVGSNFHIVWAKYIVVLAHNQL